MKKFTFYLKTAFSILLYVLFLSFSPFGEVEQEAAEVQQQLTDHYNEEFISNIQKYELHITAKGFCRYKRFFNRPANLQLNLNKMLNL